MPSSNGILRGRRIALHGHFPSKLQPGRFQDQAAPCKGWIHATRSWSGTRRDLQKRERFGDYHNTFLTLQRDHECLSIPLHEDHHTVYHGQVTILSPNRVVSFGDTTLKQLLNCLVIACGF